MKSLKLFHSFNHSVKLKFPLVRRAAYPLIKYSTQVQTWIDRLPTKWQPYTYLMRLDKPAGTWLLYLPCTWSILAASPDVYIASKYLFLFGSGSVLLRGAGCTINDMWDRNLDKQVERTKIRPLASGELTMLQALVCLGGQLSLGLAVLLQLNWYSIILGASSLILVTVYPLMKRITFYPQFVLGLTFNWGCLLGSSAVLGYVDPAAIPLYAGAVCWTLVYDTIYALQDIKDDRLVGIKSTAIRFGANLKKYLTLFAVLSLVGFTTSGVLSDSSMVYYLVSIGGTSLHYFWQIFTLKPENISDCAKKFKSNRNFGLIFALGVVLDKLYKNL
ncbi:Para-hydroxybenzoate--polyprenyltransferase, mitochondrial precursor (PHB:polyprenyltransferase) [Terramyces sp. JEL0728]|nr:Para-hydroxybenzoate--polyprenyltransferase, mitochondrial precursor (PHB:polyprenyltransferase) [Terramyces sp. JEL0728]